MYTTRQGIGCVDDFPCFADWNVDRHWLLFILMQSIARHVLNLHMNQANDNEENVAGEIDIDKMKRYIAYCKS